MERDPSLKVLNLGCGRDGSIENALSIDCNADVHPDIVHDLNQFPWPFEDNSFDLIYAKDIVEHLQDVVKTMEEIHRISKPAAKLSLTTPHFSSSNSYTDPTHKQHLGIFSFDYFTGENEWKFYTKVRFKKNRAELIFAPTWKNKLIWRLAKRNPRFYEEHLTWMFPAVFMYFELEVIK